MSQPAQTAQKANGSIAAPLFKLLLVIVALGALGFSLITIDLPNKNYLWIAAEIVVAVLLVQGGLGYLRRILASKG